MGLYNCEDKNVKFYFTKFDDIERSNIEKTEINYTSFVFVRFLFSDSLLVAPR